METLKNKWQNLPIRKFFIGTVAVVFSMIVLLSALIIWGCTAFRAYLLPDSNSVYLTIEETMSDGSTTSCQYLIELNQENQTLPQLVAESADGIPIENNVLESRYSIQKIENTYDRLTPKRKLAYQVCGAARIGFPALLSLGGILLCSFYFYRKKIAAPLQVLTDATKQIALQNLDFPMDYDCQDEMGQLCQSFHQMQQALYENHKAMWQLLEERKLMQASIAHDLRNPIAIIEGYTEYLQLNLSSGRLSTERIEQIARNLNMTAKRLETYTESVRTLNHLEELEIEKKELSAAEAAEDILYDFRIMSKNKNICLHSRNALPDAPIQLDTSVLCRILENIFSNALRFARKSISIDFSLENQPLPTPCKARSGITASSENTAGPILTVKITDDGWGFPSELLNAQEEKQFLPKPQEDGHIGIGLKISRLLCQKHGGTLKLENVEPHGAIVEVRLLV